MLRQGGGHGVFHQEGNGHRPDATGHRRDCAGDSACTGVIDIADQSSARCGGDAINPHINHHRPGLEPAGVNHLWASHRDHHDVRQPAQCRRIDAAQQMAEPCILQSVRVGARIGLGLDLLRIERRGDAMHHPRDQVLAAVGRRARVEPAYGGLGVADTSADAARGDAEELLDELRIRAASERGVEVVLLASEPWAFDAAQRDVAAAYMDQLAEAYRYGLSVKQIVDIFTTKSQFTDVYPTSLTKAQLAQALVNNIVKTSATDTVKLEAVKDITDAMTLANWTVGQVIYQVFGNLTNFAYTDPKWGNTAKQFANEIAVAKTYTDILGQSTTDMATLRSVMAPVSHLSDVSTTELQITLIGQALLG